MATPLILLADDEPHITHVLARSVQKAGFDVITAEDGEEAFELAAERVPDLIVTDLQMPYMSGIELAEKLFGRRELSDIPVVLLSARGYVITDDSERIDNIRLTLEKPFSAKNVIEHIRRLLDERSATGREAA
ncbi:MAG: response regulator [Planctomycetota bacterium]